MVLVSVVLVGEDIFGMITRSDTCIASVYLILDQLGTKCGESPWLSEGLEVGDNLSPPLWVGPL